MKIDPEELFEYFAALAVGLMMLSLPITIFIAIFEKGICK